MKRLHWYMPNHWWENRFGPGEQTPFDTAKRLLRQWCHHIRVDLCFDENDGFDVGAFVGTWKRARGPFLLHRQYLNESAYAADPSPNSYGPWRLMIALTPKAWDGFDDGAGK